MAFGQSSGPPATGKQIRELEELLQAAGHSDFRDARGPMGFNQRQAGGKFTRDEADAFIEQLQQEAEQAETATATPAPRARSTAGASPRPSKAELALREASDELLAAELQRRGWIVVEP
ncbi:MAG TPA: hypothetical protein VMM60_16065 [Ilumatobacter sp.]|nr:hypothetical protein [Ilumatobacter sp.]